ncbi:MAG TPA: methylmalonyl-CoA epimerase [Bacteroidota bacterium]|nr:methylmalonyl-CoA epimerase [Bacteroidota bacterium]
MITKLNHIGIAVADLDRSAQLLSTIFGVGERGREDVPSQRVKVAFFELEGVSLELTAESAPGSPIGKFIEKKGEGIHHLSFEVDDLGAELRRLEDAGIQLIDRVPRPGADNHLVAFLHPKSTNGVLIELCQRAGAGGTVAVGPGGGGIR